jgi:murein DD-endopeptidase MepM/ murein hydrolase activator NlpD
MTLLWVNPLPFLLERVQKNLESKQSLNNTKSKQCEVSMSVVRRSQSSQIQLCRYTALLPSLGLSLITWIGSTFVLAEGLPDATSPAEQSVSLDAAPAVAEPQSIDLQAAETPTPSDPSPLIDPGNAAFLMPESSPPETTPSDAAPAPTLAETSGSIAASVSPDAPTLEQTPSVPVASIENAAPEPLETLTSQGSAPGNSTGTTAHVSGSNTGETGMVSVGSASSQENRAVSPQENRPMSFGQQATTIHASSALYLHDALIAQAVPETNPLEESSSPDLEWVAPTEASGSDGGEATPQALDLNASSDPIGPSTTIYLNGNLPTPLESAPDSDSDTTAGSATETSPASVVIFSERSTGCETTVALGQEIPNSLCGQAPPAPSWGPHPDSSGNTLNADYPGGGYLPMPSSPLEVAVQAIGEMVQPSLNVAGYYARTLRPQAHQGNHDRGFIFPLGFLAPITSPFGWRMHPLFGDWRLHSGLDLGANWGEPVYAALSGRVMVADFLDGYGLTVILQHANQTQETLYGHLSEVFVQPGQWINQGESLGRVGSTGNSTGPHLHFEVRQWTDQGWVALDPEQALQDAALTAVAAEPEVSQEPEKLAQVPPEKLDQTQMGQAIVWLLKKLEDMDQQQVATTQPRA